MQQKLSNKTSRDLGVKSTEEERGLDLMGVRQPEPEGEVAVCDKATFVVETRLVKKTPAARRDRLTSHTRMTVQCSAD